MRHENARHANSRANVQANQRTNVQEADRLPTHTRAHAHAHAHERRRGIICLCMSTYLIWTTATFRCLSSTHPHTHVFTHTCTHTHTHPLSLSRQQKKKNPNQVHFGGCLWPCKRQHRRLHNRCIPTGCKVYQQPVSYSHEPAQHSTAQMKEEGRPIQTHAEERQAGFNTKAQMEGWWGWEVKELCLWCASGPDQ